MRGTSKQIDIFFGLKTKRFPQDKAKSDRDNIKMFKKKAIQNELPEFS